MRKLKGTKRTRGGRADNEAGNVCVYFRVLVLTARDNVITAALPGKVHSSKMRNLMLAEIEAIADVNPKYRNLVDSCLDTLTTSVKRVMKQYRASHRSNGAKGYFHMKTSELNKDRCQHTGSNCVGCKQSLLQRNVVGPGNITQAGEIVAKGKRQISLAEKPETAGEVVGRVHVRGRLEAVTEQDVIDRVMEGELPLLDRWGRLQRKKGYDDGFKKGAAKAKKENQQHLDASAFMLQYGRRLSGRAMHELRMLASESVTQAKTRRTADLEMGQSGEKIAQLQGGEWVKDRANFDKVLRELDKR